MSAGKVVILSHHDADGVTSSRLLALQHLHDETEVIFQNWQNFGLDEEMKVQIASRKPDLVYVSDLGCDQPTIDNCQDLSNITSVVLIDHHTPPQGVVMSKLMSKSFTPFHSLDNCTAGLCYQWMEQSGKGLPPGKEKAFNDWTTVGIMADVADKTSGGAETLKKAQSDLLNIKQLYWSPGSKGEYEISVASSIGALINAGRRLAYHYGAYVAYKALVELEEGALSTVKQIIPQGTRSRVDEALYPHLAVLRKWNEEWNEKKNEIFKADNITTLASQYCLISVINSPWDLHGYVANIKSREKACFCLNYGPSQTHAVISARSPMKEGINLVEVGRILTSNTEGTIELGGHPVAAGGSASKELPVEDIINLIIQATNEAAGKKLFNKVKEEKN